MAGRGRVRVVAGGEEPILIAVPLAATARAHEIVRLSDELGVRGPGFKTAREVLAPALIYGLAQLQERYRQAAPRSGEGEAGRA